MLQRYLETNVTYQQGVAPIRERPILIKLDSIREVQSIEMGKRSSISGLSVKIPYEELKALLMADERRVCYSDNVDFRIRKLMQISLWVIAKDFPGNEGVNFIQQLMNCETETEMYTFLDSKNNAL